MATDSHAWSGAQRTHSILLFPSRAEANYNCLDNQGQDTHCYGITSWYGWMRGTAVEILITSGSPGIGQYSQETWVGSHNDTRPGCTGFANNCWVEAGYILRTRQSAPGWYFYAYIDPTRAPTDSYREFDITPVYASDVNGYLGVTIDRDTSYYWYMQFATPHGVENIGPFLDFVDTANVFSPDTHLYIQAGREIYGRGVMLPATAWVWHQFIDLNNAVHVQNTPQPGDPCIPDVTWCGYADPPVNALFWPGQYPSQTNYGGTWYAYAGN